MKLFKFIFPFVIISTMFFYGCFDNKSNSPIDVHSIDYSLYFPTNVGSWWILENYNLDENMERTGLTGRDSLVVIGKEMKGGKMASIMVTYDISTNPPTPMDTSYYYMEGSKNYEYTTITPFSTEKKWILTVDFESTEPWTVLDTNVTNTDMGNGLKFTGNIKADVQKSNDKSLEIKEENYQTKGFVVSMLFLGEVVSGPITSDMKVAMTGNTYFAKGIGNVQTINKLSLEMKALGQTMQENTESIVVDYNIK